MAGLRQFILVNWILAAAITATAQEIRVPLPELLGPQSVTSIDGVGVFGLVRSVTIPRTSLPLHFESIRFEWSGTIKAGRVVGDGIEREPIEQILHGNFGSRLDVQGASYGFFPDTLPAFGPFQSSWRLDAPIGQFMDRNCIDCEYFPEVYTLGLELGADLIALGNSIPFLSPSNPGELRWAHQGLIMLEAIEADVTSAVLMFNVVPEPGAVVLVLSELTVGMAVGMCQRRMR